MRKFLKQLLSGKLGEHNVTADMGALEGLQQLGVHNKRIPAFILQDDNLPAQDTYECNERLRNNKQGRTRGKNSDQTSDIMLTDTERAAYMAGEALPQLCKAADQEKIVEG